MAKFEVGTPVETETPTVEVTLDPENALPVGKHVFQLVVVDDSGNQSQPADVVVIVRDTEAPTAVVRAPSQVSFGKSFALDGRGSSDLPPGKIVRYIWTLVD
jgi:hypothetical protein